MALELIRELGRVLRGNQKRTLGLYRCPTCGKEITCVMYDVKKHNQQQCKECHGYVHGKSKDRLYETYKNIVNRCTKPTCATYNYYGGRGITLCDAWEDINVFLDWAYKNGYADGLSIDRIDNDLGYSPDNCRWVSKTTQARNTRRIMSTNTSGYRGVSWNKSSGVWVAGIYLNNKRKYLGSFTTPLEAAKAYDNYVITNALEHTINGV